MSAKTNNVEPRTDHYPPTKRLGKGGVSMPFAIYERLYRFNFHLIEARRILEEQGLALRIDEVDEFRGLRWELDEARREANHRCCGEMEGLEARERDGLNPRELDSSEVVVRESAEPGEARPSGAENPRRAR
ncbi:hypothetical protein DYQ86_22205 [Acidobacteria bacterium AB60]|nr:hypothetical protein DYQ86_22205 [Acidobacteria bacterium AB60]